MISISIELDIPISEAGIATVTAAVGNCMEALALGDHCVVHSIIVKRED